MSEDHCIDSGTADQARADLQSPTRSDPLRNTVLVGNGRLGPAGMYDELPEKLIEAWAHWAASRLS
jgi:hypothetical protein